MLPLIVAVPIAAYTQPVSALTQYRDSVYVGRVDGGVDRVGSDLTLQSTIAKPDGKRISFISASSYGVAWLSGPGGVIREKAAAGTPAPQKLSIRVGERTITVAVQPQNAIRRISWLNGRIAISYDIGSTFYDTHGAMVAPSSFMPAEAAGLARNSALFVREQEDGTELALFARPYSVRQNAANKKDPLVSLFTAYQVGAWQWEKLGGFASNALDAFPDGELKVTEEGRIAGDTKFFVLSERVALASNGIVAREPESLAAVPIYDQSWEIARYPAATIPGDALWFGSSADRVWWWNGTALVEQTRPGEAYSAYLPWSDSAMTPSSFVADDEGLWVGSNKGLRRLTPGTPDEALGYAGFVRVPFGVEATSSSDPNAKKLSDAVFAWRFAGVDKAGADGGLMIASIYSVLGVQLPTTATELAKAGTPVKDELRFGDVLISSSSAALYLGNGITVEVRGGRVQNGEIWSLGSPIVVRP